MTIRQFSVALVLLSTNCGLRSPFSRGPSPFAVDGAAGGAPALPDSGLATDGATSSGLGGFAGAGDASGVSISGVGSGGAADGVSSRAGSGTGSSSLGSGGGDMGHIGGSGAGNGSGTSSGALGGSGAPGYPGGVDAGSIPADAAPGVDSGSGHVEPALGDGGLSTTIVFPDAGAITYPADPTIPAPLPSSPGTPTQPGGGQPPLSDGVNRYTTDGCGEPPACILRASIVTLDGHAYGAAFSSNYPKDNCARDFIKDDNTILIGDTFRSAPSRQCVAGGPSISVAFNIDYTVWYLSFGFDSVWSSEDGFRSEWQVTNASAVDNGSYFPLPGTSSRLEFFWVRSDTSESVGQLQVPLLNRDTGTRAVGYLEFDVFLR